MKVKQKAKRVVSGLLTAVTLLSTVLSPISSYAAELPKERKLPLLEEVQSRLDEDEIVLAKDYQVEVGTNFDVKTDFTGLEIKDAAKVKITFEEAKNEQGEDFTTSHADTYKTVYQVETVNQEHPNYQISRNVVVKEIEKESESPSADAEQSETKETEEDEEDSEKPSEIPTETPDVSEGNAAFDALVEQMAEQDTFDEESGLALHDVMEQAANQGVDFESMETGEVATFSAIAARDASVGSQQVTIEKQEMGSLVVRKCNTLSDLLTEYVSLYGKEKWALSTYEGNVSLIRNYIEPMIGTVKLSEINTRFMERFYQGLLQTKAVGNQAKGNKRNEYVSASTVRDIHKLLRNCFEQAIKWEMLEKNPCIYATVPKHKSQKREIWTAETLMYAMDVCEDQRLKLAINLSFSCSMRLGELLGLTWDCVDISPEAIEENRAYVYINKETQRVKKESLKDLEGKDVLLVFPSQHKTNTTVQILKTPKTESSIRKVFLPKSVANMLVEWKAEQDEVKEVLGEEYIDYNLVMATTFGNPIGTGAIRGQLKKLIEEHNLPPVVFHSLRHSSVTYKLKLNGGDIKAVQGDSGHSQVDMVTDVYSHIIDEDRRRNAELFEEAFYEKKNLDPKMREETTTQTVDVPDDVDAELLAKVLSNPEIKALLASLAKAMK